MSLSKQLYIIISIIFFMIFAGNFIISVKNTKEYLQDESITKAQDTATALGMSLKELVKDKKTPEIESVINAIANSGFYKEIRLEDAYFTITSDELIKASSELVNSNWEISNVKVDSSYGTIENISTDLEFSNELMALEDENTTEQNEQNQTNNSTIYNFTPSKKYQNGGEIPFRFTATNEKNLKIDTSAQLDIHKVLVKVTRDIQFASVPKWFINLLPISLKEQSSEISDGWKTTAVIYVSANPGEAYAKLYEQVKNAVIYSFFAFVVAMLILYFFVRFLLKPLKELEKLANDISIGKFSTIKKLPWTTEMRAVSQSFNDMSTKIETIINKLNKNLQNTTKKLSLDSLTSLPLKNSFETDMKNMFINKSDGYIFSIKIFDLASFAKSHTNNEVNSFIKKFASILKETKINDKTKISAYRFYGSEFALIAQGFNESDTKEFIKELQEKFTQLSYEYNKKDIAHIGATTFNPFGTTVEILQSANEAFEKATLIGQNEAFITDSTNLSRDMESWRELVTSIIENSNFDVRYIGDCNLFNESNTLFIQEAFTNIRDDDDNEIPIGTFVSIAEKYERIVEFDKKVISKVINHILINNINHNISINLSLESINNTSFIAWLEKKILEHKDIAKQLVFSITAYAVAKDMDKFKFFVDEMHKCGAKIIIKRFETKFIPLDNIKNFNLDYIRLARDYTNGISSDLSKQNFVESIQELATLLNIKVFAENVKEDEDLQIIKEYSLYGASR